MKKIFGTFMALAIATFAMVSCGVSEAEKSDYEFTDSILKYNEEPVAVITKVKKDMQEMELTSGNVTFSEERPIMRVSMRLLKKLDSKAIYSTLRIVGIDQDDSHVKNASWICYDNTQSEKFGEFLNKEVGDTITIKLANKKKERYVDFHMDQIAKLKVDFFSPHTESDEAAIRKKYGLSDSNDDDMNSDE